MKKIMIFLAETFYELLCAHTLALVAVPMVCLCAWHLGGDEIVRMFGACGFYFATAFTLFCVLQGWILAHFDPARQQAVQQAAYGGQSFCQTRQAWMLGGGAALLLLSTLLMLIPRTPSPAPWLLAGLDVLSAGYLVWLGLSLKRR